MKQNEPLETNMRPLPKNGNQKTIRKSYVITYIQQFLYYNNKYKVT